MRGAVGQLLQTMELGTAWVLGRIGQHELVAAAGVRHLRRERRAVAEHEGPDQLRVIQCEMRGQQRAARVSHQVYARQAQGADELVRMLLDRVHRVVLVTVRVAGEPLAKLVEGHHAEAPGQSREDRIPSVGVDSIPDVAAVQQHQRLSFARFEIPRLDAADIDEFLHSAAAGGRGLRVADRRPFEQGGQRRERERHHTERRATHLSSCHLEDLLSARPIDRRRAG